DRTGRPIWITEWNNGANWTTEYWPDGAANYTTANATKQLNDIKAILQVLDTAHFIERYSIYNWVQNSRAMVLGDTLTLAGKYYAANKPAVAFNRVNEVIPAFTYSNPTLVISFPTTTKLTLKITDPNAESLRGFILEKKMDNGAYSEFYRSVNSTLIEYNDTLNLNAASKIRYRVRSILADGTTTGYSNEVGFDVAGGGEDATNGNNFQYGTAGVLNLGWNPVFFKKSYAAIPSIILGAPTNSNSSVLLSARAKYYSLSRFTLQVAPWAYQKVTSLAKEESVPYLVSNIGSYDFGTLKAKAGKTPVTAAWTPVVFSTPFDTIPVVFANQLNPGSAFATTVRVRNITKTGFEARLQKETAITTALGTETVSYFAITPGTGTIDNKKVIVGRTADKAVSTIYSTIYYGDSIANPIFISQMQTCNDDTVTATMRCLTVSSKYANVVKQRERSTGVTVTSAEMAGWMVINPVSTIQAVNIPVADVVTFFPNPVRDVLYLTQNNFDSPEVEIYTMMGVLVKQLSVSERKINVSELLPGCYVLKTKQNGSRVFVKL
ncbi:MAG TPA: T9SS type A sorting domain-containing protein, partial [Paludibacter sp.]